MDVYVTRSMSSSQMHEYSPQVAHCVFGTAFTAEAGAMELSRINGVEMQHIVKPATKVCTSLRLSNTIKTPTWWLRMCGTTFFEPTGLNNVNGDHILMAVSVLHSKTCLICPPVTLSLSEAYLSFLADESGLHKFCCTPHHPASMYQLII